MGIRRCSREEYRCRTEGRVKLTVPLPLSIQLKTQIFDAETLVLCQTFNLGLTVIPAGAGIRFSTLGIPAPRLREDRTLRESKTPVLSSDGEPAAARG